MHPLVRDLYKRFILVGKNYPQGLNHVREIVKKKFFENKDLKDEIEIKRAVGKGRYSVRELQNFNKFHKYRMMKKRYDTTKS
jgi:hypothetical protein